MNIKLIMMMETVRSFFKREEGASAIEYALIAGLMAVAVIFGVGLLGGENGALFTLFNNIKGALDTQGTSLSESGN